MTIEMINKYKELRGRIDKTMASCANSKTKPKTFTEALTVRETVEKWEGEAAQIFKRLTYDEKQANGWTVEQRGMNQL